MKLQLLTTRLPVIEVVNIIYCGKCLTGTQKFCCLSTMTAVWREHFPYVIIPKNHRFSQCTTCAQLNSDLKAKINFEPTSDVGGRVGLAISGLHV